jgi:hypothetical protein
MVRVEIKRIMQNPITKVAMRPGSHNLPDEVLSHWFVKGMIASGDIVIKEDISTGQSVLKPSQEVKLPKVKVLVEEIKPVVKVINPAAEKIQKAIVKSQEEAEIKVEEIINPVSVQVEEAKVESPVVEKRVYRKKKE